jgi:hypothetical protein
MMRSRKHVVARRLAGVIAAVGVAFALIAPVSQAQDGRPDLSHATTTQEIFGGSAKDPYTLAVRAYVWGFPLVSAATLRQSLTNPADPFAPRPPTSPGAALNNLGLQLETSDPRTLGVGVNNDTLYALAWLDLHQGPFVLETPNFGDRYYTFQMAQADTSTEWSFGSRTHGSQLPPLFIYDPHFKGKVPKGMIGVRSSGRYFLVAGRILVDPNVPGDFEAVHALQQQIKLRPWSKWARGETGVNDPPAQRPLVDPSRGVDPALRFLEQLGNVLPDVYSRTREIPLLRQLTRIGVSRRFGFDPSKLTPEAKAEVIRGLADAMTIVRDKSLNLGVNVNGWTLNLRGPRFGYDWLLRAGVALDQRYVTVPEEALYPVGRVDADGQPLNGANAYRIHFAPGQLPPVGAFWSITMYDNAGHLVANPINRYSIGDRTPGMITNPDGSLDILIQNTQPATGPANWLPSPTGQFYIMLRLYVPGSQILDQSWQPPAIENLSAP